MATVKAYVRSSKKNNIVNVRFRLSTPGAKLLYYVSDLQINVDLFDNKREEIKSRALYPDKERRIFNEKVSYTSDMGGTRRRPPANERMAA